MPREIKIAVVQSLDGHVTVCGPDDSPDDYPSPMGAAISWHIEAGHLPAGFYWAAVMLPDLNEEIPVLAAHVEPHELDEETRKALTDD